MQAAKVRFRKPSCVCPFRCEHVALRRGEACIVKSDRGLEYGTCVVPPEPCPEGLEKEVTMHVVRKATHQDEATRHQIQIQESKAREFCIRKIQERNLPMKLVDLEYTFDKRKIVFYFTAEERVDFRELVRDLAHELRTRIELRHIQVRDEAKVVGGLGPCGLELCCKTWMSEFMPISMKMAKRQNLSLNPAKISGQCGRLMCCLGYENANYPGKRKSASAEEEEEQYVEQEDEAFTELDDVEPVTESSLVAVADVDEPQDAVEAEAPPSPAQPEARVAEETREAETKVPPEAAEKKPQEKTKAHRPSRRRKRRRGKRKHRR